MRFLFLLLCLGPLCNACSAASSPQASAPDTVAATDECNTWRADHPAWIFCDDFESPGPLVAPGRYFEYGDDDGDFIPLDGVGLANSRGMRTIWEPGEVGAGGFKLGFGRTPNSYMDRGIENERDFRQIYYRMYLKNQPGWQGNPAKLSRATIFSSADNWSQAMIAHLWSDDQGHLLLDPASCVDGAQVQCQGYNDFEHLQWLNFKAGKTPIFATETAGTWYCVEAHVRLNDPGQANGVHQFWIDGQLEARRDSLNFVGDYTAYGINAIFFENYWNAGSPALQERYFDNIVVSTQRIGCGP
ncbi:MAG: hypothetical protein GKR89_03730 [Candidatus Latescibacteria bacterium]|nr:hypothetical protein [Candidatus Latescibacterota bacterium]